MSLLVDHQNGFQRQNRSDDRSSQDPRRRVPAGDGSKLTEPDEARLVAREKLMIAVERLSWKRGCLGFLMLALVTVNRLDVT